MLVRTLAVLSAIASVASLVLALWLLRESHFYIDIGRTDVELIKTRTAQLVEYVRTTDCPPIVVSLFERTLPAEAVSSNLLMDYRAKLLSIHHQGAAYAALLACLLGATAFALYRRPSGRAT